MVLACTSAVGCTAEAAQEDEAETADSALGASALQAVFAARPRSASCEGKTTRFTLTASPNQGLRVTNLVVRDRAFPQGRGLPGAQTAQYGYSPEDIIINDWDGDPLDVKGQGYRYVSEARMLSHASGFADFAVEHVRCVSTFAMAPTFAQRLQLAYEYDVTGVYPARRDPAKLVKLGTVAAGSLPAALQAKFPPGPYRKWDSFTKVAFEGKSLYIREHSGDSRSTDRDIYDASANLIVAGNLASQELGGMMTNEEWATVPRAVWTWRTR